MPWRINGEPFRVDPHYRHMFGQNYEPAVAAFLRQRVRPGDICFDVGANVGVYVLQLGRWTSDSGTIVAFEPNPSARRVLERHVAMNDLSKRVVIVDSAIADRASERQLYSHGVDGMARLEHPNVRLAGGASGQAVGVVSLDAFVAATGLEPKWIIMDIEGFEIQALLGAKELIRRLNGHLGWVIEFHPQAWPSVGTPREALENLLSELNLRLRPLTGQADPLAEYGHVFLSSV